MQNIEAKMISNLIFSYYELKDKLIKHRDSLNALTKREKEILLLLFDGLKSKEIASKLFISDHTVKNHRKSIKSKLKSLSPKDIIFLIETRKEEFDYF